MSFDTPTNPDWVKYAYVGMKVVCVKPITSRAKTDLSLLEWLRSKFPKKGEFCSLDGIFFDDDGVAYISIKEYPQIDSRSFLSWHYSPVRSTRQGMEALNSILKSPEREIEDA